MALFVCAAAEVAFVAVHILAYRLTRAYMPATYFGFAAGLMLLAVADSFRLSCLAAGAFECAVLAAGDVLLYTFCVFLTFNIVNASESSIRFRIMRELDTASRPLTESELTDAYNDRTILDTRLKRLLGTRHLELIGGRYRLTSRSLASMARIIGRLKLLLTRRASEFDRAGLEGCD